MRDHGSESVTVLDGGEILGRYADKESLAIAGFLARYRGATLHAYTEDLRQYMAWCRQHDLNMLAVTRGELEVYIRDLERRGLAQATVSRRFGTVALLLEYAWMDDLIADNPAKKVTRPKIDKEAQRRTWLELGEFHRVISDVRTHYQRLEEEFTSHRWQSTDRRDAFERRLVDSLQEYVAVLLLADLGMRANELCSLNADSIHIGGGHAYIEYIRKGGKISRPTLPLEPLLALERLLKYRRSGPLFLNRKGHRLDRAALARLVVRVCRRSGVVKPISPHSFRRSFATVAALLGVSTSEIQRSLFHTDSKVTDLYIRLDSGGSVARTAVADLLAQG